MFTQFSKIFSKTHYIALFFKKISNEHAPELSHKRVASQIPPPPISKNNLNTPYQGWPVAFTGGICHRYLPPVFTGKYRRGQYSQKWRLPAFTGIYKYFINFSSNYIVDSPSYLLYYAWTP